jgi:hypothetical protein
MKRETVKPGKIVQRSGIYRDPKSGERTTLVQGKVAPPTPEPRSKWVERDDTKNRTTQGMIGEGLTSFSGARLSFRLSLMSLRSHTFLVLGTGNASSAKGGVEAALCLLRRKFLACIFVIHVSVPCRTCPCQRQTKRLSPRI